MEGTPISDEPVPELEIEAPPDLGDPRNLACPCSAMAAEWSFDPEANEFRALCSACAQRLSNEG